ncbi:hypothetical protein [Candidatus Uabimicrobium sp. HlEnr_7]|uniref:hypothetical protein n=1 Tax=Candidatus Uabimicrobium helgolandensis TaxID=3095367 RepID=UPI003556C4DF
MSLILYVYLSPQILYGVASVCIGLLGRRRLIGFWGFLLVSLILTPVVGLLILALTEYVAPSD